MGLCGLPSITRRVASYTQELSPVTLSAVDLSPPPLPTTGFPTRLAMRSTSVLTASAAIAAVAPLVAADLDPNLRRSFWGLAYASEGVRLPYCGATQEEVTTDILQVAQLTPRIKAYGSDCNQTALIMQAIQDTNVDLTV